MPYNKNAYEILSEKYGSETVSLGVQKKVAEEKDILNGKSFWEKVKHQYSDRTIKRANIAADIAAVRKNPSALYNALEKIKTLGEISSKEVTERREADLLNAGFDGIIQKLMPKTNALLKIEAKKDSRALIR